jgi:hypothetical protein
LGFHITGILRVVENRVVRRMFGFQGEKITEGWGKLDNELRE